MNHKMKGLLIAAGVALMLALLSSCSSSRRLGCPMQITRHEQPQKPVC